MFPSAESGEDAASDVPERSVEAVVDKAG